MADEKPKHEGTPIGNTNSDKRGRGGKNPPPPPKNDGKKTK